MGFTLRHIKNVNDMPKTCKKIACSNPVFGAGYCKFHQFLRNDKGWEKIKEQRMKERDTPANIPEKYKTNLLTYAECFTPKIKPYSPSKRLKKAELRILKETLIAETGSISFFTGKYVENPDLFHIFPIGKFPEYETQSWNVLLSERWINRAWDQGTWEEIQKIPNIEKLMAIIYYRDNHEDKQHSGSFYEQLQNRKDK